jgi:CBS domain-containing protein
MKARDVMTAPVVTVAPETSVSELARLLIERRISAVPVVDHAGKILGIVSEGDLLRRAETGTERRRPRWLEVLLEGSIRAADFAKAHGATAGDVMTRDVIAVSPATDLAEIADLLERSRIKRVPVVEGGVLVGIVSRANLLHGLVARGPAAEPPPASDNEIRRNIVEVLAAERWVDQNRINVVVNNGVAHLWGAVPSDDRRRALKIAVRNVPGVVRVDDHLSPHWFANESG